MKRKSVDIDKIEKVQTDIKVEKELYIVTERKPQTVDDYIPIYNFKYEGVDVPEEAEQMANSLITFIKANSQLVLQEYNSNNIEAVQEGFQRAIAISELFIK